MIYQHILDGDRDQMFPVNGKQTKSSARFQNVEFKIYAAMVQWPAEGIAVYQRRYGPAAETMLRSAGPNDRETLDRVMHRYLFTDAGVDAGIRLMNLASAAREFGFLSRLGDELLKYRRDLGKRGEQIRDIMQLAVYSSAIQQMGPGESDRWNLSIGGNAERDEIPAGHRWPDAPLYHIALHETQPSANIDPEQRVRLEKQQKINEAEGVAPATIPAVDRGAAKQIVSVGSPLVVGNDVMVMAQASVWCPPTHRIGETLSSEVIETYMLCFGFATGGFKWDCYLGDLPMEAEDYWSGLSVPPLSPLAYSDGSAYGITNCGAVAAIDPYDGTIEWVDLYAKPLPTKETLNPFQAQPAPWPRVMNPPIIAAGKLFALPADSQNLLILDTDSGAEIKRVDLKGFAELGAENGDLSEDMQTPLVFNTLLAADGNQITLLGRHDKVAQVVCFDWNKITVNDTAIVWASAPLDSVVGRSFITADSAIIPTARQLIRVSRDIGLIQEDYPAADRHWPAGESAGNVLAIDGRVIVAGAKQVTVYSTGPARSASH